MTEQASLDDTYPSPKRRGGCGGCVLVMVGIMLGMILGFVVGFLVGGFVGHPDRYGFNLILVYGPIGALIAAILGAAISVIITIKRKWDWWE